MPFDNYKSIAFERRGRILTITINRPERLNVVDAELHSELARVFIDAAKDEASDVIVFTGAGDAFCAGGDLKWLEGRLDGPQDFMKDAAEGRAIVETMLTCDKPIVARLNGDAIGLGATLALLCDIVVASDKAKIADPHVKVGLTAGDGGAILWPLLIGHVRAKEFLLLGDMVEAPEAARMGLINRAVPREELDAVVARFADRLGAGAQGAIRTTKATMQLALKQGMASAFETGLAYEGLCFTTRDHREAVTSFLGKRKPQFGKGAK